MASFLDTLLSPFTGQPAEDAAAAKQAAILRGQQQLETQYTAGRGAVTDQYTKALEPYTGLMDTASGGYQAYADASGAAGKEGQLRAQEAFTTDPGYQFSLNEQLEAARRAGAAGGVAIGNTADLSTRIAGRAAADQYGSYVSRLLPWLGQGLGIAGGQAGVSMGLGGELNRSFAGQGDAAYRAAVGAGNAEAEGLMAPMYAGQNMWNMGLNLGKAALGAGGIPGLFRGGGGGGSAPSMADIANQYAGSGYYGGSPASNPLLRPA